VTGLQAALPRAHYTDPATWRREVEQVWRRSWVCVGRLDATTAAGGSQSTTAAGGSQSTTAAGGSQSTTAAGGSVCAVEVAGESVLLTRDDRGLHALANVCRHRGAQLVDHRPGEATNPCAAKSLRCRYHSWTYGLDGALLRAPYTEVLPGFEAARFGLRDLAVQTWGGYAFVRLHPTGAGPTEGSPDGDAAPSLLEDLGDVVTRTARYPLEQLVSARRIVYDVAANWKVIAENYNECYHCAGVHPELTRLVPAFGHGGTGLDGHGLDWEAGVSHRDGAWTFSFSGTSPRRPFAGLDDDERVRHKGELVYPNLLLSLAAEHVASFVLQPLAVDRTRVTFDVLVEPDQAHLDVEDCAGFWDLVNRQDWGICESVQRGMTSSLYTQGWYAPMEDASLDIRRWLLPRLASESEGDS
jgi:glycine betaine catabolism A